MTSCGRGCPGFAVQHATPGAVHVATAVRAASYPEPDGPGEEAGMNQERSPEDLLGLLLDAYWT